MRCTRSVGRLPTMTFGSSQRFWIVPRRNSSHDWRPFAATRASIGGSADGDGSRLGLFTIWAPPILQREDPRRPWNLYVQAGALGELRSGGDYFSCSVRVGLTNRRRTFGVHAGFNACDGGLVPAIGAWFGPGNHLRLNRAERRAGTFRGYWVRAVPPPLSAVGSWLRRAANNLFNEPSGSALMHY